MYNLHKRVLVTGGAGFLGSHLCERLLDSGQSVICVDSFFTGVKSNIEHLMKNPAFEVIRHDITFPLYVEVDEIYNLACPASTIHYQHDPVQTTKTSVLGAINMLGLAKSPSGNDIAYSKTRLLSSFIFGLFSRTSAVTTTPWRILATAISCYCPDFRRNSRTKTFFFPWDNRNW